MEPEMLKPCDQTGLEANILTSASVSA